MTLPNGQYPALKSVARATGNLQSVQPAAIVPVTAPAVLSEQLYALLPAIYRLRDAAQGEQLRALLSIIESELDLIESDMEALYESWFIETCAEWVVPYIGDLLAVRDLNAASPRTFGQERRAYVANTLFYRQRKGTMPVLEQLARDITGWGARAVESLQFVTTTQNANHLRTQAQSVLLRPLRSTERPLRSTESPTAQSDDPTDPRLSLLATPFETGVSYTPQIRPSRGDRIRYNPVSVALYLWQLQSYQIEAATPRAVAAPDSAIDIPLTYAINDILDNTFDNVYGSAVLARDLQDYCFTFNPLGYKNLPLFNLPQTEADLTTLAQEENVPGLLTKMLLKRLMQQQSSI
jgi:hypothetical protein